MFEIRIIGLIPIIMVCAFLLPISSIPYTLSNIVVPLFQAYLSAIQRQSREGGDLRVALEKTLGNELQRTGIHEGRIVHQSCKTKRVVDTDDKQHLSELQADGRVVTETRRTTEHEEVSRESVNEAGGGGGRGDARK